jgi:ribosomal protein L35AE/L33A
VCRRARRRNHVHRFSASFTSRDGFRRVCHGAVAQLHGSPRKVLRAHFAETYGGDPENWGNEIAYCRIDATWLVAFAMTDAEQGRALRS